MDLKPHINKNQHAYLVEVGEGDAICEIEKAIEEIFELKLPGNPDYRISHFETLGIDEARGLKEEQGRRAFGGNEKFFIVSADTVTREAQNALLKVFEEPTEGTYIFLIIPNARQILPTLLSRVRVVKVPSTEYQVPNENAIVFLKTSVEKRLNLPFVKKMIEEKDKQVLISFFDDIESFLHNNFPVEKTDKNTREFFDELIKLHGYAGDRSSSVKMLLEHIALTAPVIAQ